jgi:gliding motility-associated-like protein
VTTIGAIVVDSLSCTPDLSPVAQGTEVVFTVYTNPSAQDLNNPTYEWTNSEGTVFGTEQSATFEIINEPTETVSVLVTTANGCMVEATKTLEVEPAMIMFPNVFTPNGDDTNETFNPVVKGNIEITAFRVYNRWGQLVFDDHTAVNGWDGMYNGKLAPSDVYVYYIAYIRPGSTETEIESSDVTLVR